MIAFQAEAPAAVHGPASASSQSPTRDFTVSRSVVVKTTDPTPEDFVAAYPASAAKMTEQGGAEVTCEIGAGGRFENCHAIAEYPEGFGLGEAASRLAEKMSFPAAPLVTHGKVNMTPPPLYFIPSSFVKGRVGPSTVSNRPAPIVEPDAKSLSASYTWRTEASESAIEQARPPALAGRSGRADFTCLVSATGALGECRIAYESPRGFGLGEAALKLAPLYAVSPPRDPNGRIATKVSVSREVIWR